MRSTMKNDLLHSSLHISINGPSANIKEVDQLLEGICNVYGNEKRKKIPQVCGTTSLCSTETENNVESTIQKSEKGMSCLDFAQPDFYEVSFMISHFAEQEFSGEDDDLSKLKSSLVKTYLVNINYHYLLGKKEVLEFFRY